MHRDSKENKDIDEKTERKTVDVRVLKGMFSYEGPPKTVEDMQRGIEESVCKLNDK